MCPLQSANDESNYWGPTKNNNDKSMSAFLIITLWLEICVYICLLAPCICPYVAINSSVKMNKYIKVKGGRSAIVPIVGFNAEIVLPA